MARKPTTIDEALEMARQAADLQQEAEAITDAVASSISTLRGTSNMSQAMLASAAGLSQPYLSQVEGGTRRSPGSVLNVVTALHSYSHDARDDLARARGET